VDVIVHLGDACNGPIDPVGTAKLLRSLTVAHHVRGNGDRMVGVPGEPNVTASARFARERLSPEDAAWLGSWPQTVAGDGWLACHGSPASDMEYLLENVTPHGVFLRAPADIAQRLGLVNAGLVLCGHTHLPRVVQIPGGRLVVNPGSAGMPAYRDAQPFPHAMEAGCPHAWYAIAERSRHGWSVELCAVAYDWEEAARLAEEHGWPEWARIVRTGFL
jgi:predicted phosphodiesterase